LLRVGGLKLEIGGWIGFQILPPPKNLNLNLNLFLGISVMSQFIPHSKLMVFHYGQNNMGFSNVSIYTPLKVQKIGGQEDIKGFSNVSIYTPLKVFLGVTKIGQQEFQ
jgi:hypothetical protein